MRGLLVGSLTGALTLVGLSAARPVSAAPTTRTVYVTVVDGGGKGIPGLTAADFGVKEGGSNREIVSVEPAKEKFKLALMLDQALAAQGGVRVGMAEFAQRMISAADIALIVVTHTTETAVDFTSDLNAIVNGIRNLTLDRTERDVMLADAVQDAAKRLQKAKAARAAIVLVTTERSQAATFDARGVLNEIAKSGALFSAVTTPGAGSSPTGIAGLRDMTSLSELFDDGTRQSGGRRIEVLALTAFSGALQQIADDLSSQYLITYTLPDGVKPSDRLAVTLKKPGGTLRAPSRIPVK